MTIGPREADNALPLRLQALEAELAALAASPGLPAAAREALQRAADSTRQAQAALAPVADVRPVTPAAPQPDRRIRAAIHTVGIAVQDLEAAKRKLEAVFAAPLVREAVHAEEGSRWAWYQLGPIAVELIAPTGPESRVQRFLDRRGEGLFLLSIRVPDMQATIEDFRAHGLQVVYDSGRESFPGGVNNFLHPKSFFGTMIEFRQLAGEDT